MSISDLPAALRRRVLGFVLSRGSGGPPDLTKLRSIPDGATWPLRRDGLDPVAEVARARAAGPVTRVTRMLGMNVWLVTGYDEAREVLADQSRYSNDMRHLIGDRRAGAEGIGGLGMTDPPEHTRLRKLLTPEFTRRRLSRLDDRIEAIVANVLDDLERGGPEADLVADFGFAVPFRVICELLGLTPEDREEFRTLGAARFDLSAGGYGVFNAATSSREFLIDAVARQRRDPGDGMIGALLTAHGSEFDDVELGGLADGVFLGGYETSASMLSMGAYLLSRSPEEYARLRTGTAAEVDEIVEELLRYLCPVQLAFPRFARESHDLFGTRIGAGDVVVVSLAGANRDPAAAPAPEDFAPRQGARQHLAFGHGMHRCVGAELARMELRAALRGLSARFPRLRVRVGEDELAFRELSLVYGLESLPVELDPESRSASRRTATWTTSQVVANGGA